MKSKFKAQKLTNYEINLIKASTRGSYSEVTKVYYINFPSPYACSLALIKAIEGNHWDIAKLLLFKVDDIEVVKSAFSAAFNNVAIAIDFFTEDTKSPQIEFFTNILDSNFNNVREFVANHSLNQVAKELSLYLSAVSGNCQMMRYFIDGNSVDIDAKDGVVRDAEELKVNILKLSCIHGHVDMVEFLRSKYKVTLSDMTLLDATSYGQEDLVVYLLTNPQLQLENKVIFTALEYAIFSGENNLNIIKLLYEKCIFADGATEEIAKVLGRYEIKNSEDLEVFKFLLNQCDKLSLSQVEKILLDISSKGRISLDALRCFIEFTKAQDISLSEVSAEIVDCIFACFSEYENLEGLKYIKEKFNPDVHYRNDQAVRDASKYGELDCVKYLISECGADVTAKNNQAIYRSAENGHVKVVKYILMHGADVNANENKAIKRAIDNTKWEMAKTLLVFGANLEDESYAQKFNEKCVGFTQKFEAAREYVKKFEPSPQKVNLFAELKGKFKDLKDDFPDKVLFEYVVSQILIKFNPELENVKYLSVSELGSLLAIGEYYGDDAAKKVLADIDSPNFQTFMNISIVESGHFLKSSNIPEDVSMLVCFNLNLSNQEILIMGNLTSE